MDDHANRTRLEDSVDSLARRYEWWEQPKACTMLDALRQALEQAGPRGRLCRRDGLKADGTATSWFYVADATGAMIGAAFNDSWLCPPIC